MVAQAQGRLDEAADYYVRSLAISTDLSDQPGAAAGYYQLGQVAAAFGDHRNGGTKRRRVEARVNKDSNLLRRSFTMPF
jgi:hypothetical protein